MRLNFVSVIALVSLTAMTLTGCAGLEKQLRASARDKGTAGAQVNLPILPEDCRTQEPHAPLVEGVEVRSVLKRERAALDRANDRVRRCAEDFYDPLRRDLMSGSSSLSHPL